MPTANYLRVQRALQSPGVRRKLREVADRKLRAAQSIAASEGHTGPIWREDGTRPKGRPYSRIIVRASDEFGDSETKRRRLLGRVINL